MPLGIAIFPKERQALICDVGRSPGSRRGVQDLVAAEALTRVARCKRNHRKYSTLSSRA